MKQRLVRLLRQHDDDTVERHFIARMYLLGLPFALKRKFRPQDAEVEGADLEVVYELKLTVAEQVRLYEIAVAQRKCSIRRRPTNPDVEMGMRLADLMRLSAGLTDGPTLMAAGRMTFAGDAFMLARFPGLFGLTTRSLQKEY